MISRFRKKIIRPLYPISLAILGLAFAFHFGEIRGTVAISSDSEESKGNYFEAWNSADSKETGGTVAGESFEANISGGENSAQENLNTDNIINGDLAPLDNPEDLSGAPAIAGEEITDPSTLPQDPVDNTAPGPEGENAIVPNDPQENTGGIEDNSGSGPVLEPAYNPDI